MATLTNTIPEKTIERLSEYRRTLLASHRQGITHIFSHVLAGIHGITAVQVRRDLMLIGFSSDTKKGYDVQVLIEYISRILDRHRLLADEGGSESRAADHQCRHTGGAEFHLHAAELPAGDHRRELRHHHAARKSRLLRQGERREQFVTVCRRGRER